MRKTLTCVAAGWVAFLTLAPAARGQVGWDSPMFTPPVNPVGWGVYLVDPSPGRGIGILATWRGREGPGSMGFRVGLAEDRTEDLAVFGGVDISGNLHRASYAFPLNLVWVAGGGLGAGRYALLSFPLGVSLGRTSTQRGCGSTLTSRPGSSWTRGLAITGEAKTWTSHSPWTSASISQWTRGGPCGSAQLWGAKRRGTRGKLPGPLSLIPCPALARGLHENSGHPFHAAPW
jgi:hypothetical protein